MNSTIKKILGTLLKTKINPNDIQAIDNGYSKAKNFSYKNLFFIRVFPNDQNNETREHEILCNQIVANSRLAPKIIHADQTILITEFIEGAHPNFKDYQNPQFLKKLVRKIKQLHSIKTDKLQPSIKPYQKIQPLFKFNKKIHQWQLEADQLSNKTYFIHGDLNPMNILNFQFVDWREAGVGSPFCDLSEIAVFLKPERHSELLSYYFDKPSKTEKTLMNLHWKLRLALFAAWGLEQAGPTSAHDLNIEAPHYLHLLELILNGQQPLKFRDDFRLFSTTFLQTLETL